MEDLKRASGKRGKLQRRWAVREPLPAGGGSSAVQDGRWIPLSNQFMGGAFPGSQFLDGFLDIGHVCFGEEGVGSLGNLEWDAVFA